jgi:putative Mg2+ transporter-C (MgtC) family protein
MLIDNLLQFKEIIIKLIVATILGSFIGLERDKKGRAAGLRTHILVSLGSALFMIISTEIYEIYKTQTDSLLRIDPARIAAQIITGIGFIGAGAIIRSRFDIRGLTTASSIWTCAGIGMAVGIGYYIPAFIATFIALFTLIFLNKLELFYFKDAYVQIDILFYDENKLIEKVENFIKQSDIDLRLFTFKKDFDKKLLSISIIVKLKYRARKNFYSKNIILNFEKIFKNNLKEISWKEPDI